MRHPEVGSSQQKAKQHRSMAAIWLACFACLFTVLMPASALPAAKLGEALESGFSARIDAPEPEVVQAVHEIAADQIIHGTYSYEKEKILYGAHRAESSPAFRNNPAGPEVFYKVAEGVLAPRYFKDSEDVGTITVRYAVEAAGPRAAIVRIDAVFVDARHKTHASQGNVEAAEFGAIRERVQAIALKRQQAEEEAQELARRQQTPVPRKPPPSESKLSPSASTAATADPAKDLEARIEELRRQVVVRVKSAATPLKSAPFHSATNVESLAAQTEVVVLILTPYWYGVETESGKRGWIQRGEVEPLP
jgi:hypothetical protein